MPLLGRGGGSLSDAATRTGGADRLDAEHLVRGDAPNGNGHPSSANGEVSASAGGISRGGFPLQASAESAAAAAASQHLASVATVGRFVGRVAPSPRDAVFRRLLAV